MRKNRISYVKRDSHIVLNNIFHVANSQQFDEVMKWNMSAYLLNIDQCIFIVQLDGISLFISSRVLCVTRRFVDSIKGYIEE